MSVNFVQSNADILFSSCFLVFNATTPVFLSKTVTVVAKRDFVDNGQRNSMISPYIRPSNGGDDWKNVTGPTISVSSSFHIAIEAN